MKDIYKPIIWAIYIQGGLIITLFTFLLINKAYKIRKEASFQSRLAIDGVSLEAKLDAYVAGQAGEIEVLGLVSKTDARVTEFIWFKTLEKYWCTGCTSILAPLTAKIGLESKYITMLKSGKWAKQGIAIKKLGDLQSWPAIPYIIEYMESPNIEVRIAAARSLSKIGGEKAIQALLQALSNPQKWTAIRIQDIVLSMGQQSVAFLLNIIEHSTPEVQKNIIEILGLMANHEAIPTLINYLINHDEEIKIKAIKAMGNLKASEAEEPLIYLLEDEAWVVRAMAAKALGSIGTIESIPPLFNSLKDAQWWVRLNSAESLIKLGPVGRAALEKALTCDDRFVVDIATQTLKSPYFIGVTSQ